MMIDSWFVDNEIWIRVFIYLLFLFALYIEIDELLREKKISRERRRNSRDRIRYIKFRKSRYFVFILSRYSTLN